MDESDFRTSPPYSYMEEAERLLGWATFNMGKKKYGASVVLIRKAQDELDAAVERLEIMPDGRI